MSNLSELLPSGGGQNNVEFTASGAVASGKPVILNANGTVTEVATSSVSEVIGSATAFESASSTNVASTYDSTNNKIVIAYTDNGNSSYGTAVVGTVSGTSISFGTPVVFESSSTSYVETTFEPTSGKVVVVYRATSQYGYGIVGTVSGTSISFGSSAVFENSTVYFLSCARGSVSNTIVIGYSNPSNSYYATSAVGTISGTSISFGTPVVIQSVDADHFGATFDSTNNKTIIVYRNTNNSNYGTAVVGTVSGTSISFGSSVVFASVNSTYNVAAFDSVSGKVAVACTNLLDSYKGYCSIGAVSGTSISFGTSVVFKTSNVDYIGITVDLISNKVVVAYRDRSDASGDVISGVISGDSIAFGTASGFDTGNINQIFCSYDEENSKTVISYINSGAGGYGFSLTYSPAYTSTNLTAASFIGLASAAISDTATGDINVKGGINEVQTGLTIGSDYYVQTDGTLGTTADDPSVKVGQAISATTINMMDLT